MQWVTCPEEARDKPGTSRDKAAAKKIVIFCKNLSQTAYVWCFAYRYGNYIHKNSLGDAII